MNRHSPTPPPRTHRAPATPTRRVLEPKRRPGTARSFTLAVMALWGATACATAPNPPPAHPTADAECERGEEWIALSQDDVSIERQIADFLRERGGTVNAIERGDDLVIGMLIQTREYPPYRVLVDTVPLEWSESGEVEERAIKLLLATGITIPAEAHPQVLFLVNELNAQMPVGRFTINPRDHELELDWSFNIVGDAAVHMETFNDGLLRLMGAWHQTHATFSKVLRRSKLPTEQLPTEPRHESEPEPDPDSAPGEQPKPRPQPPPKGGPANTPAGVAALTR